MRTILHLSHLLNAPSFALAGAAMAAGTLITATPAMADVVTDWNEKTVGFVNAAGRPAPAWILDLAMVHIAIHDAVQAYQHRFETYNHPIAGAAGSVEAAVATAARDVLVNRFPAQATAIHDAYLAYLGSKQLHESDPGVSVGQLTALAIIDRRSNDGAIPPNPEVFRGGTEAGQWRPTPPTLLPMTAPWMGSVTPFALKDVEGLLHEPAPPHLTSGLYARDYDEVKALGAQLGSSRTQAQTDLAFFYSGNYFVQMNGIARAVALARLSDVGDSARLLALANLAAADALIVSWNNKRTHNFWRPSTAIANGHSDGNTRTIGDASWRPLIPDPPYPDYTSGANSITSAFMRALALFFEDDTYTFTVSTTVGGHAPRTYTTFSAVADDVEDARVYLGIHFRFADVVARRQGKQAADWAFGHVLRPVK